MNAVIDSYIKNVSIEKKNRYLSIINIVSDAFQTDPVMSYGMPTYIKGNKRVHIGIWKDHCAMYPGPEYVSRLQRFNYNISFSKGTCIFLDRVDLDIEGIKHLVKMILEE
jgi:uncharacterized protein YdhG (YjbR/CyaY superfamily)